MTAQQKKLAAIPVVITIAIVVAILLLHKEEAPPPKQQLVITLRCGKEWDYVREIQAAGGGKIIIPVLGECETGKVLMPPGRFWIDHDLPVGVVRYYESEPPDSSAVLYEPEKVTRPKSRITAIRFRNDGSKNGNKPVTVSILPR